MKTVKTKTRVNDLVIELFNSSLISDKKMSFEDVNKITVPKGYLVHPDACSNDVLEYIDSKMINYNSTFYKSWNSIITKNRFELLIDQLIHYASTYGTNFEGEPYIPEESKGIPAFSELKVINVVSAKEVIERCENMLFSGIALKQETIENILVIFDYLLYKVDIEKVKNREAKMFLYKITDVMPIDPVEMVRFLVYSSIGKSLLIKDKQTIAAIKAVSLNDFNKYVEKFGIENLASVFHRFKPLILAFKNRKSASTINKLRKLADKYHVPMKKGYFENLLSDKSFINQLTLKKLEQISNFKKILLLQTINKRIKELDVNAYVIRNGKLWIKQGATKLKKSKSKISFNDLAQCFSMIYDSLVESLKIKKCKINIPNGVNLTLPTSEKSFIGNYPLGTSFDLSELNAIIGINWKQYGDGGARDIDLSLLNLDGYKIGWNADYRNSSSSIIFSGDMTSADPEATELLFARKGFSSDFNGVIKANVFSGESNVKLKLFFATEEITRMKKNYMVDPNNVLFAVDIVMDSQEKSFGVIGDNKFILTNFRTGRGKVSSSSITDLYTEYALKTNDCYLSLNALLKDAGFEFTDKNPDIDLKNLTKDSLINLLNK